MCKRLSCLVVSSLYCYFNAWIYIYICDFYLDFIVYGNISRCCRYEMHTVYSAYSERKQQKDNYLLWTHGNIMYGLSHSFAHPCFIVRFFLSFSLVTWRNESFYHVFRFCIHSSSFSWALLQNCKTVEIVLESSDSIIICCCCCFLLVPFLLQTLWFVFVSFSFFSFNLNICCLHWE